MASHRLLIASILVVLAATMAAADHEYSSPPTSTVHHHHHVGCTSPVIHNNNVTETTRKPRQRDRYVSYEALRGNNVTRCVKADDSHHKKDHVDDHGCSSTTSPSDNIKKARKIQQGDSSFSREVMKGNNKLCGWQGNSYVCSYRKKANN